MCGGCCKKKVEPNKVELFKEYGDRKCTDVLCCILFIVFWLGMIVIAAVALGEGTPSTLVYGTDYEGKTCGVDGKAETQNIYYPRITEDLLDFARSGSTNILDMKLFGVCVKDCPSAGDVICTPDGAAAVAKVKETETTWSDSTVVVKMGTMTGFIRFPTQAPIVKANCWITPLPTKNYFYRCLWARESSTTTNNTCTSPDSLRGMNLDDPDISQDLKDQCVAKTHESTSVTVGGAQQNVVLEQMLDSAERVGRYVNDAKAAVLPILICGGILALIVGFLWLLLVQAFAWWMVWLTIWGVILSVLAVTLYAYFKSGLLTADTITSVTDSFNDATGTSVTVETPAALNTAEADLQSRWRWFAYFMTAFALILLVMIVAVRSKIKVAIGIIKEAAKAVRKMPMLMTFPFCSVLLLVLLLVYWVIIASYVYSQQDITISDIASSADQLTSAVGAPSLLCASYANESAPSGTSVNTSLCAPGLGGSSVASNSLNNYLLVYHFFGLLWTSNFITGFFIVCTAGAISYWYFTPSSAKKLRLPVINGVKMAIRFHLGSIAFGSLVIAIVQFIRAVLEYLDRKSKNAQEANAVLKFLFKILKCCMWCFEKCIKYIATNAYIIVAMKGKSFCPSALEAVSLIIGQAVQFAVVGAISTFLFVLGKIMICATCGFFVFMWLDNDSNYQEGGSNQLESLWVPVLLTLILSYFVAAAFMDIYDLAIDTILLCYCVDVKRPGAGTEQNPYYARPSLLAAVGKKSSASVHDDNGSSKDLEKEKKVDDGDMP